MMHFVVGRRTNILWLICFNISLGWTIVSTGRPGHGIVGYGISMDKPSCAYACQDSITNPLDCDSRVTGASGTSVLTQGDDEPSPECYVSNDAYLQTLAYCVASHCENVEIWRLEKFWELNVAGRRARQPKPKYSYQEALIQIATPPNTTTPPDKTLVGASLVDDSTYKGLYNAELAFTNAENVHELYGWVRF